MIARLQQHPAMLSIALSTLAFLLFSSADACLKYLGMQGYNNYILLTYSSAISVIIAVIYIISRRGPRALIPQKSWKLHLMRSLFVMLGVICIVNGLRLLPMAEFYTIVFLSPFLVALGGAILFKENMGMFRFLAIAAGFGGVVISVSGNLNHPAATPLLGIIFTLGVPIFMSSSYMVLRKMGPGEYPPIYPLYAQLGVFVANVWFAVPEATMPPMIEWPIWLLYGSALFLAVICVSSSITIAPLAAIPAPFQYTQMIWGLLFGFLLFGEIPQETTLIGAGIIIGSGLFMIWREYDQGRRHRPVPINR